MKRALAYIRIAWLVLTAPARFVVGAWSRYKHATQTWDECERALSNKRETEQ